jgi:hypothetical protein
MINIEYTPINIEYTPVSSRRVTENRRQYLNCCVYHGQERATGTCSRQESVSTSPKQKKDSPEPPKAVLINPPG